MKIFPIAFVSDKHYIKYTSVAIASLISNSNINYKYKIFILTEFIEEFDKKIMKDYIKKYKHFSIDFIELTNIEHENFFIDSYINISTYYKLYIPKLLSQYDRILYLDGDLVVDTDITEFISMDFEDNAAIAIQDKYMTKKIDEDDPYFPKKYFYETLKINDSKLYFNAGVILYNIKKINELNISEIFFDTLTNEIKKPILLDQDIQNSVLNKWGGVKLVSEKYNFMTHIRDKPFYITYKDIINSRIKSFLMLKNKEDKKYYIYHFLTSNKPWNSNRPDNMLFYKYLFSIHEVNPPKEFVKQILIENKKTFPIWWKLFMKFFS